jgi:uncharacterized damage-inducible protein DinB
LKGFDQINNLNKIYDYFISDKIQNMKRSLLFLFALLTCLTGSVLAQFTQSEMLVEWQRAKTYTKTYLDAMPADDYGFRPTPEIRSFAEQMLHLATDNYGFACYASGKSNPNGDSSLEKTITATKEATTRAVLDSYDFMISTLQNMTATQMSEKLKRKNGTEISRAGVFGKGFEHQTHHRGQTTIYLRLEGVKPPPEMLF